MTNNQVPATESGIDQENAAKRAAITLTDIVSVVEILQVCTARGVWRVHELSSVGQLYDRLSSFVEEAGVQIKK